MDKRRRQYANVDVWLPHKRTGSALLEKFGAKGLLAWVLLVLAAKRAPVEGEVAFATDSDLWREIGMLADPPAFTADTFLRATGHLKQTSRRRVGHLTYVSLTRFGDWQNTRRTSDGHKENPRSEAQNTNGLPQDYDTNVLPRARGSEIETEKEKEVEAKASTQQRRIDELFEAIASSCEVEISSLTRTARGALNSARKDLAGAGATPTEVHVRADRFRRRYSVTLTPSALAKHCPQLGDAESGGQVSRIERLEQLKEEEARG